ncbi:MAG: pentapeptide repeat-containing protein [bacterium]
MRSSLVGIKKIFKEFPTFSSLNLSKKQIFATKVTVVLALCATAVVLWTNSDTNRLYRLKKTNYCPKCNLRNADLTSGHLHDANLSKADLSGANLSGADLRRANLIGTNLIGANLSKADLSDADLRLAMIKGIKLNAAIFCNTRMPSGKIDNSGCKK